MRISLLSWLFLTPLCLLLLGVTIASTSSQCLDHQQSLLLQLKDNIFYDFTKSTKLIQWNQTSDCCTWDGVTCHRGLVVGLNLGFEGISGITEDSSLFSLQHLEHLDLSHNNFDSPVFSGISQLTKLTYLNLSNAGFLGQIPVGISSLKSLVTLDLSSVFNSTLRNELKLEDPNLSMLVQNLSELEELYLDGVNISAPGSEWCRALSSSVPKLRVLSLTNCFLSGPIDQVLEKLQSLSVIRLDQNNFSASVPGFFSNFQNLTCLSLRSCELNGTFPHEIFQVSTLQTLDISGNILLEGNLPRFSKDNAIQILELNTTSFSGTLPKSIGNLRNLSKLNLHACLFNGTLPHSMGKLTQLVYLDLSSNDFIGPIPSFHLFENLTYILLSHNSFTGEIPLANWEGLSNLVLIDLQDNLLNGSFPLSLFSISSLEEIFLSNNELSGHIPKFETSSSSKLHTLDLRGNNLEGPLPSSILKLKGLMALDLSDNKFSGKIQLDMFQGLGKLVSLDLSYNNWSVNANGSDQNPLWSSFPHIKSLALVSCNLTEFPYMKTHSKLIHLDLSDNQIHGEIPNWIWELGNGNLNSLNLSRNYLVGMLEPYSLPYSLNVLDLHLNNLQGKIPILPTLAQYVDFSSNNFTSSIPTMLGDDLSFLGFFSVSNNSLTGFIPESICNVSNLQVLDLSNNNLSGEIPKCISNMNQTLVTLNLGSNNFSGSIHNGFPANCLLKILDLNGNSIEGEIPKSLANCTHLEVLDLGHNKMAGKFPCFLRNMPTFRVLVLRFNKFHGWIGCSNTTIGTWEKLQILDLAHNNFSGEVPGEWLTKWQAMMVEEDGSQTEVINQIELELGANMPPSCNTCFALVAVIMHYFAVTVTVISKGHEMELVKMLTFYTYIDLSNNNFQGSIPEELGQFKALHFLNWSNNALTGQIPSSLGSLRQLESLDLSRNSLSGTIPPSLQSLTFLSYLNLSSNKLVGRIPTGNQFKTFSADSFIGNEGLCGLPLIKNCSDEAPTETKIQPYSKSRNTEIDWNLLSSEIGFSVGFGIVVWPLIFCKRWRKRHFELVDDIVVRIFPSAVSRKWFAWSTSC